MPLELCEAITGRYGSAIGHWDRARRQHRMNVESHLRQHFGEPNDEVLRKQPCATVARMSYVVLRCICSVWIAKAGRTNCRQRNSVVELIVVQVQKAHLFSHALEQVKEALRAFQAGQ